VFPTELLRSTHFRLAAAFAAITVAVSLLLFGFVYWEAKSFISSQIGVVLEHTSAELAGKPEAEIGRWLEADIGTDPFHVTYDGLFSTAGQPLAGNLVQYPDNLPPDGHPHPLRGVDYEPDLPDSVHATGVARVLRSGDLLVMTRDVASVEALRRSMLRALGLGLVPASGLLLLAGLLLGRRALVRVRMVHQSIARIMQGDLQERLPTDGSRDDLDSLVRSVNGVLDQLEGLLQEVKGVGDAIAHELRSPLARARARLERGCRAAQDVPALRAAVDAAMSDLDQAVALIQALLRIGEIETGRRRGAFGPVDLAELAREVHDLFQPLAEEEGRSLALRVEDTPVIAGDAELLMEAVGNLVDNALKYTPRGGAVSLEVGRENGQPAIRVRDNGPGIQPEEREAVFRRFYRGKYARSAVAGHGLGLSIVGVIARLHDGRVVVRDAPGGGAVFVIVVAGTAPLPAGKPTPLPLTQGEGGG
jgi:signal transduction histidine kinase